MPQGQIFLDSWLIFADPKNHQKSRSPSKLLFGSFSKCFCRSKTTEFRDQPKPWIFTTVLAQNQILALQTRPFRHQHIIQICCFSGTAHAPHFHDLFLDLNANMTIFGPLLDPAHVQNHSKSRTMTPKCFPEIHYALSLGWVLEPTRA